MGEYAVQKHPSAGRKDVVGAFEECAITLLFEGIESLDGENSVNFLVKLFPALQSRLDMELRRDRRQFGSATFAVTAAQRDADDVDVIPLYSPDQSRTPPAADVQQCHARFEVEFAQRQIVFGVLRFFETHVLTLEVRAG